MFVVATTSMALLVFVCGAACADCLAANAKGGGSTGSVGCVGFGANMKMQCA